MNPEEEVELKLWNWLITNGNNIKQIYFNRRCKLSINLCCSVFTTTGINKKPDFLIELKTGEIIAVEIKDACKSKNVYDAGKILDTYLDNYFHKKTIYYIDGKQVKIDHFVIATEHSPDGHLFKPEHDCLIRNNLTDTSSGQWSKVLAKTKNEPFFEYNGTSQFQRNLFSIFRRYRDKQEFKFKKKGNEYPSLGILMSEIYEDGSTRNKPFMFIMQWKRRSYWQCNWEEL